LNKSTVARSLLALQRLSSIAQLAHDPWRRFRHWMFTSCTDLLYRRMLLQPNYYFDNHAEASYELTLGKDRESMQREEEARLKEKARKEREMDESVLRAALVPYTADNDEDVDDDDIEKMKGFLGGI
jgi:tryptophan 2,3-dioxygenase